MKDRISQKSLKWIKLAVAAAALLTLIILAVVTAELPGEAGEGYAPRVYSSVFSLLPPVIAIVLALITKEVYSSLFVGITVGALLYANGKPELALNTLLYNENGGLVVNLTDLSHAGILVFVVILGTLVVLMNRSGAAAAFGRWASKHIKSKTGAALATVLLGVLIFVDDGFNCMTVGSVMRPITDRHNVSRAKLAYLIDATAAPICIIAPVSSWAAAVTYAVPEEMNVNGFQMFLQTILFNYYALVTLLMIVSVTLMRVDYGPMRLHEKNAAAGDLFTSGEAPYAEDDAPTDEGKGKVSNLVIPVVTLIVTCILGMVYTGGFFSGVDLITAFGDCDAARGLVTGSLITLIVTFILYIVRDVMSFKDFMACLPAGFRSMCAPMIILILSWNLSGVTGLLGASGFVHDLVASGAGAVQMFLPFIVFAVSLFLAFSTGTSWGTFTILIPIVCSVFPQNYNMLVVSIAACLSGAVCGDHCSPISDTTIMSSAGARCNHVNHVSTQLPYAFTAAGIAAVGYLIAGVLAYGHTLGVAAVALPVSLLLVPAVLWVIRKKQGSLKTAV